MTRGFVAKDEYSSDRSAFDISQRRKCYLSLLELGELGALSFGHRTGPFVWILGTVLLKLVSSSLALVRCGGGQRAPAVTISV